MKTNNEQMLAEKKREIEKKVGAAISWVDQQFDQILCKIFDGKDGLNESELKEIGDNHQKWEACAQMINHSLKQKSFGESAQSALSSFLKSDKNETVIRSLGIIENNSAQKHVFNNDEIKQSLQNLTKNGDKTFVGRSLKLLINIDPKFLSKKSNKKTAPIKQEEKAPNEGEILTPILAQNAELIEQNKQLSEENKKQSERLKEQEEKIRILEEKLAQHEKRFEKYEDLFDRLSKRIEDSEKNHEEKLGKLDKNSKDLKDSVEQSFEQRNQQQKEAEDNIKNLENLLKTLQENSEKSGVRNQEEIQKIQKQIFENKEKIGKIQEERKSDLSKVESDIKSAIEQFGSLNKGIEEQTEKLVLVAQELKNLQEIHKKIGPKLVEDEDLQKKKAAIENAGKEDFGVKEYCDKLNKNLNEAFLFSALLSQNRVTIKPTQTAAIAAGLASIIGSTPLPFISSIANAGAAAVAFFGLKNEKDKFAEFGKINPKSDFSKAAILSEKIAIEMTYANLKNIQTRITTEEENEKNSTFSSIKKTLLGPQNIPAKLADEDSLNIINFIATNAEKLKDRNDKIEQIVDGNRIAPGTSAKSIKAGSLLPPAPNKETNQSR